MEMTKSPRWPGLDAHRPSSWKEPSRCIFCGSPGPLTKEHVYSNWTRRIVPRTMKKYDSLRATSYHDRSDFIFVDRPGDIRDWQVRCVCGLMCNNGWMRQLDNVARPIMIPLVKGEEVRVTPDDQRIISAWASMKAMVAEYAESEFVTTHHMQRQRMMKVQLPPAKGWSVWIGRYVKVGGPNYWSAIPFLVLPDRRVAKRRHRRATYYNSHATTQIVGELLIHVMRCPMHRLIRRWTFRLSSGMALFRIWPPSSYSIRWPGGTIDDGAAYYIANAVKGYMERLEADRLAAITAR